MKTKLALLLFALAACASAQAQINFTVTGTATIDRPGLGFMTGDSGTFTFTMNANAPGGPGGYFDSFSNTWWQEIPGGAPVFTNFSGTGVTGTFVQFTNPESYSYVGNSLNPGSPASSVLEALIWGSSENTGLSLGAGVINNIQFSSYETPTTFAYPGTYTNPGDYFGPSFGTYALPADSAYLTFFTTEGSTSFNLTSYSISSASAIPEPSTYAALAGLAALGLAVVRRHRASRPAIPLV